MPVRLPHPPLDAPRQAPPLPAPDRRFAVPRWAGAIAVAAGCIGLLGWVLGVVVLDRILPGFATMKANTALALVVAGAGLLLAAGTTDARRLRAARLCGLAVAVFGAVVIAEYLFGDALIDTLLFQDAGAALPGRPSPHTAASLVLAGAALAAGARGGPPGRVFTALLGGFGLSVLAALVGHAYGVSYLKGAATVSGMSIPTVVTLVVIWVGLAWLRPDHGLAAHLAAERPSAILLRRLAPVAVLGPFVLGLLRAAGERLGLYDMTTGVAGQTVAVIALVGVLLVITARALDGADARRSASERRFRDLVESGPDAIVIADADGRIVLVNAQAERLLGYPRGELVGSRVERLMPDGLRAGHERYRAAFAANASPRVMSPTRELSARRADGSELPVEITLAPLRTDQGLLVSAALRDVSDRRAAEQTSRRLAAIVEHTDDAIVAETPDGRISEWNAGAERLYGYRAAEVLGRPASLLVPPDRARSEEAIRRRVIEGREVEHEETVHLHRDGSRIDVALTISPIRDASGVVVGASTISRDIRDRKRIEERLQYMADHDPLTGLFNRRRFEEELEHELNRVRRFGPAGAVLAIDLDHFKYVNDSLGHAAGDELLARIAQILGGRLRATDVLARIGGDEFAVIVPGADRHAAGLVADDLLKAVREEVRTDRIGPVRRISASVGIACFAPGDELSGEELLVEADIAMYDAKEGGRDRAAHYDAAEDRHKRMHSHLAWVERIRNALAEDRFTLHAQPMSPLDGRRPGAHELLLRMVGEDGVLVPPAAFLYIAERFELVRELDRWVLEHATELLGRLQRAGHDTRLSVNLSARSIEDPGLARFLARELAANGADPRGLWLEVTESAAIAKVDAAKRFALEAQELGCGVALDDFGAGFASFYYLKHLPFDYLKIDGEFIRGLPRNRTNRLVVQSIVEIARGLGKQTIAEFVGDDETLGRLRALGVDYVQGFYVGRPVPAGELLALSPPGSASARTSGSAAASARRRASDAAGS